MRRILWYDPEFGEPSTPVAWPAASVILATVFLNVIFVEALGGRFWPFTPLTLYGAAVILIPLALTLLFFVGPALATRAAKRPIFGLMEDALGTIPALGVRACCVVFLSFWTGSLLGGPLVYLTWHWTGRGESLAAYFLAVLVIAFVYITVHQGHGTRARLALFTCKLFFAIAIAALLRVQDGWQPKDWHLDTVDWRQVRFGFSEVFQYAAPLALLAANFGSRSSSRKDIWLAGLSGMALPLTIAITISGWIAMITHASSLYLPSLAPTIFMALLSDVASSAAPARMIVAMVTVFGAMRFGARWATTAAGISDAPTPRGWVIAACLVATTTWCSFRAWDEMPASVLDWSGRCLGITGGVITAGFLAGRRALPEQRRIDWVGCGSLIAGLCTPLYVKHGPLMYAPDPWWCPWLLPSYVVAFSVCVCGRLLEKALALHLPFRHN